MKDKWIRLLVFIAGLGLLLFFTFFLFVMAAFSLVASPQIQGYALVRHCVSKLMAFPEVIGVILALCGVLCGIFLMVASFMLPRATINRLMGKRPNDG